jgi:hypothetical protein
VRFQFDMDIGHMLDLPGLADRYTIDQPPGRNQRTVDMDRMPRGNPKIARWDRCRPGAVAAYPETSRKRGLSRRRESNFEMLAR